MRVGTVMVEQFGGLTQAFIPSELVQDVIVARREKNIYNRDHLLNKPLYLIFGQSIFLVSCTVVERLV